MPVAKQNEMGDYITDAMMPPKIPNIPEIGDSYSPGLRCPCSNPLMYRWLNPDSSFHLFLGQPLFAPDSCPSHPAMDCT